MTKIKKKIKQTVNSLSKNKPTAPSIPIGNKMFYANDETEDT